MTFQPLAERLRPKSLDEYIGQRHLVGPGAVIRRMIESGNIASFILWGPPGVGKTTLARIIAEQTKVPFYTLSAVTSGVKDVRDVLERCKKDAQSIFTKGRPILFIDEIHRFNKSQQDSLLGAVENGTVTLIGATTENPSFEVIRPLLSRAQVYVLQSLDKEDLLQLLKHAIHTDPIFQDREVRVEQTEALLRFSGGDARKLLNILDLLHQSLNEGEPFVLNDKVVTERLQQNPMAFDKDGEMHYDIISAFIKSFIGLHASLPVAKTPSSSLDACAFLLPKISAWQTPMPCYWQTPPLISSTKSGGLKAEFHSVNVPSIWPLHQKAIRLTMPLIVPFNWWNKPVMPRCLCICATHPPN